MVYELFIMRVTGLEPVRRETHAPQTCLSACSSTLAFRTVQIIAFLFLIVNIYFGCN